MALLSEDLSVGIYRFVLQTGRAWFLQTGRACPYKVAVEKWLYPQGLCRVRAYAGIHFTRYGRGSTGGLLLSRRMPFWSSLKRAS